MAKTNKFKKGADLNPKHKTSAPSASSFATPNSRKHPREPSSSDDVQTKRPRTSEDGENKPEFLKPAIPDRTNAKSSTNPQVTPAYGRPSYESLLPPHVASLITSQYDVHNLSIQSNSKMKAKATQLLELMENGFSLGQRDQKPGVVALVAKSDAAGKMIGVVEIAKRELEKSRFKWFQYSAVARRLEELKKKEERKDGRAAGFGDDRGRTLGGIVEDVDMQDEAVDLTKDDESEEEGFQTMALPERTKVRSVPYLTIFMARVPVKELRDEYGEQSYDPPKEKK